MPNSTFHHQRGASNFLIIAGIAVVLTIAAVLFLYFEFENIEKSGIQTTPETKQLSEQEKKALLEKLRK
jgi:LPS O-antigen subunit length determinant protein (WzzB/FepE family)